MIVCYCNLAQLNAHLLSNLPKPISKISTHGWGSKKEKQFQDFLRATFTNDILHETILSAGRHYLHPLG
jgi:hypothetical protein